MPEAQRRRRSSDRKVSGESKGSKASKATKTSKAAGPSERRREAMAQPLAPIVGGADHAAPEERAARAKAVRERCPRSALAACNVDRDPLAVLAATDAQRLPELVPIRYARMAVSPFTFLRGAAALMARDLGPAPSPGFVGQICGDAHVLNFGGFASPDRQLLFGLNDFDETIEGPLEWDTKRLAASLFVAGRDLGMTTSAARDLVLTMAQNYRNEMGSCARRSALEVWYARIELASLMSLARTTDAARGLDAARRGPAADVAHVGPHLVEVNGALRIADHPPLIYHPTHMPDFHGQVMHFWENYAASVAPERLPLVRRYRIVDVALKVVGVGSVGTRCAVALLVGNGGEHLFLQFKEAARSVWEPWTRRSPFENAGERVVVGQRVLQAAGDVFLGWVRAPSSQRDFYVRQLRDLKVSIDLSEIKPAALAEVAAATGRVLALAHAKSADAVAVAAYLGRSATADDALARFAEDYAVTTERDWRALKNGIKSGRVPASTARS